MVLLILELLLVGWLPGVVLFRAPVFARDRRAALDADERLFWAVVLSALVSLSIVLALAAAHRYTFERLLIGDGALSLAVAAACRFRLRLGSRARRPGPYALLPLALVALGLWQFFPSSAYIIGGKDPGVYVNEGVQIAQRGALVIDDPDVKVPTFARDLFFPLYAGQPYYSLRFMGFFVRNPDTGVVVGQFPHLFPASMAIGYGLDGLTGVRRTVGIWAMLGLLAVYFAGARLFGRWAAFAGAALLGINVVEVWFSRYPNTEMVMQALLFAALLAAARAFIDDDPFFAPAAGALLGLLLFLRIDVLLAVVAIVAAIALLYVRGGRLRPTFWLPLAIGGALCAWYLAGPLRAYVELPIIFLTHFAVWQYGLIAAAGAAALTLLVLARRRPTIAVWTGRLVPSVLAAVVLVLSVYAFAFRQPSGRLAPHDAYALRTFALFYLTVPGLVAALIGYVVVARRLFWRAPAFLLTFTAFSIFFFYKIRIVPDHFWMARRFVPVILPGALLLVGAAALAGVRLSSRRVSLLRPVIGILFVAVLARQYARATQPLAGYVEYAGVIPRLERIASQIGNRDLLVVESRNASDAHVLALPLAYVYARHVLVLASPTPDKARFASFLQWCRGRYDRVLFMGGGGTDLASSQWSIRPIGSERFEVPQYDAPYDAYPSGVRAMKFAFGLYAFGPAAPVAAGGFDLTLGGADDPYVLRFLAKETTASHTFRWSRDRSYVLVTRLRPTDRTVTIWMNDGGRPPDVPPADVTVSLAGRALGTVRVTNGFHPYTFPIPASVATQDATEGNPLRLAISTTTWNPSRALHTTDDRELGVMVQRVTIE